jgi:hypothetical protein
MKIKPFVSLLPLILLGCSKNQDAPDSASQAASSRNPAVVRPHIAFIESPETIDQRQVTSEAFTLFTNKNYAALEALAAKYRISKEHCAYGLWKLAAVYNGLEPSDDELDAVWDLRLGQVQEWVIARPESVMPRIALARILTSYGWKARGSDYADKVKDENWQIFVSRLEKAFASLEAAKKLKEHCPAYWSSLQLIALGLQFDRKRYDALFAQAIHEYPDYVFYYEARAQYLLPRWNGKEGEWEKDLAESANRVGGEAGDVLYTRVIWDMEQSSSSDAVSVLKADKTRWQRVENGFAIILKETPNSLSAKMERAKIAALVGEKTKARSYFLQTKGEVDLKFWDDRDELNKFLDWTFPR